MKHSRMVKINWDLCGKIWGWDEQPEEELPDSWLPQTPMKIVEGQGRLY